MKKVKLYQRTITKAIVKAITKISKKHISPLFFKNHHKMVFTLVLIFSLFVSPVAQSQNDHSSYILTKEGEKIFIEANSEVFYNGKKIEYYPYSDKEPSRNWSRKKINGKYIEKIVDGDRLYLPYLRIKRKNRWDIYRIIAKTKEYTLVHRVYQSTFLNPKPNRSNKLHRTASFYILDNNTNKTIASGPVSNATNQKIEESIAKVRKIFGDCLEREDYFDNVYLKHLGGYGPVTVMDTVKRFLYNVNQLDCKTLNE